jgi:5-methyltetrahydrofolate--homocysteine methyltransferase
VGAKFLGLRQQLDTGAENYLCISDFVAPGGSEGDWLGLFACQCGEGVGELKRDFERRGEVDKAILLQALADRLAEAFAELLHLKVRTDLSIWGYAADTEVALPLEQLLKGTGYQGIRPAPGYPMQPDHREKATLWALLDVDRLSAGRMTLTSSFMMQPASSVCALCFAHPGAQYFALGPVNKDQVEDYSRRGGYSTGDTERWLGSGVLGYDAAKGT